MVNVEKVLAIVQLVSVVVNMVIVVFLPNTVHFLKAVNLNLENVLMILRVNVEKVLAIVQKVNAVVSMVIVEPEQNTVIADVKVNLENAIKISPMKNKTISINDNIYI